MLSKSQVLRILHAIKNLCSKNLTIYNTYTFLTLFYIYFILFASSYHNVMMNRRYRCFRETRLARLKDGGTCTRLCTLRACTHTCIRCDLSEDDGSHRATGSATRHCNQSSLRILFPRLFLPINDLSSERRATRLRSGSAKIRESGVLLCPML